MAFVNTLKSILPAVKLIGRSFHYNQALWKKVQELGLTELYKEDRKLGALLKWLHNETDSDMWIYYGEQHRTAI